MKVRLLSTKTGLKSGSLKRLAEALTKTLGYKVWRATTPKVNRNNLRYGDAVNKLTQYQWFKEQGLSALEFTTHAEEAFKWNESGDTVIGRMLLNASCGKGIVVQEPGLQNFVMNCPVYTKYKPKKREFRVHVFKDKVVAIVEKKLRAGQPPAKVRNLANGYVFCQEFVLSDELRNRITTLSLAASKVSLSDFKGVDLGYNEKKDDLFVIEVNSAPGIEGSNVNNYVEAIKNHVHI